MVDAVVALDDTESVEVVVVVGEVVAKVVVTPVLVLSGDVAVVELREGLG